MKLTARKLDNGDHAVYVDGKPTRISLSLDTGSSAREWDAWVAVDGRAYADYIASSKSRSRLLEHLQAFTDALTEAL